MKIFHYVIVFFSAAIFIIIIAYAGGIIFQINPSNKISKFDKIDTIRIAYTSAPLAWIVEIAKEKKYFKQNGLYPIFLELETGREALNSVIKGACDFSLCAEGFFIESIIADEDIEIIASIGYADNELKIAAFHDKIAAPHEIINKTVSVQKYSTQELFFETFLLKYNISKNSVKIVYEGLEEGRKQFSLRKRDAILTREPYISFIKNNMEKKLNIISEPGLYIKIYNLVVKRSYSEKNHDKIEKVLKSLIEAEKFINENKHEFIEVISGKYKLTNSVVKEIIETTNYHISLKQSLILSLEDVYERNLGKTNLHESKKMNVARYINDNPLEKISPNRVSIWKD